MNLLITSSTKFEAENIADFFKIDIPENENFGTTEYFNSRISLLIIGIGVFQTIYNLQEHLHENEYDFILNIGICGSFTEKLPIGTVVNITQEQFGDFGINNNGAFINLFDTKFIDKNEFPFKNGKLINEIYKNFIKLDYNIKSVSSVTVNTTSGEKAQIEQLRTTFNADIESMEGAGFFYVCLRKKIPFLQIRAISNLVEPRNAENWQVMTAISKLSDALKIIVFELIK